MFHAGRGELVLDDELPSSHAPEGHGGLADNDVEFLSNVFFADAVDDVSDAHPPVQADGAAVFVRWVGGASAMDNVSDVVWPFGSCAAGSAVTDVLSASRRPGVFEE